MLIAEWLANPELLMFHRLAVIAVASALVSLAAGCAATTDDDAPDENAREALAKKSNEHWFYSGPLEALGSPEVTIAQTGHTARVRGVLPTSLDLAKLPPHARVADAKARLVDFVYPIATGAQASYDAKPGLYSLQRAVLFRPDGTSTSSFGTSFITWGGFPFLSYDGGIAMHGPISFEDNRPGASDFDVLYLKRGTVSHGCNRMLGEHVVEVSHILGMTMRKVYDGDRSYTPPKVGVRVIAGYDQLDGKYVDVDYPTDSGFRRPGKVYGDSSVTMFGSWVATEMPNGADLPSQKEWEGGVSGKPYKFEEHAKLNWVCSVRRDVLLKLRAWGDTLPNKELPHDLCEKKTCVVDALLANKSPDACR